MDWAKCEVGEVVRFLVELCLCLPNRGNSAGKGNKTFRYLGLNIWSVLRYNLGYFCMYLSQGIEV